MPSKEFRKWRRIHGLQLPLHPQQLLAWGFLFSFTLYMFLALIPAIHSNAQIPLFILNGLIFGLHYSTHLAALLLDPSDPALLALYSNKPVPEFNKDLHKHVIENGRCHLCSINISTHRTKHCSVCNKLVTHMPLSSFTKVMLTKELWPKIDQFIEHVTRCVHIFDHHCKWLNQCIGRRNYRAFFICVVSAILMSLSFISLAATELSLYCTSPQVR